MLHNISLISIVWLHADVLYVARIAYRLRGSLSSILGARNAFHVLHCLLV